MSLDKYKAVLWGLAIGDALGAPTEFKGLKGIKERWGPEGIQHINQTDGKFTDDTQMTVALAEGLLDARENIIAATVPISKLMANPGTVMPHVAKQFVSWAFGPKNNRAPGTTCMAGCRNLRAGQPWDESGVARSKGCGSAMRSSPVGLVYKNPDELEAIARASSIVTHGHPAAVDAAHAAAFAVRALLEGTDPVIMMGSIFDVCANDENFCLLLSSVLPLVGKTDRGEITPEEVQTHAHLGESWVGDEAVASALYCFLLAVKRGEGYVETVRYGANTCGDSDSIAAIAGSFAGAYWGLGGEKGIPQDWIDLVEDKIELETLAQRLYALAQELETVPV